MRPRQTRLRPTPAIIALMTALVLGLLFLPLAGLVTFSTGTNSLTAICTDRGVQQVALDFGASPVPAKGHGLSRDFCPLCYSHTDAPAVAGLGYELSAPIFFAVEAAHAITAIAAPWRQFLTGRPARAPPAATV